MANPGKKDYYKKKQDPLKPWGRTFRIRPIHHVNDAVEVKVIAHGTECARVICPPLTGMSRADAAKKVFTFVMEINRHLQRAFEREASRGPTKEVEPEEITFVPADPHNTAGAIVFDNKPEEDGQE